MTAAPKGFVTIKGVREILDLTDSVARELANKSNFPPRAEHYALRCWKIEDVIAFKNGKDFSEENKRREAEKYTGRISALEDKVARLENQVLMLVEQHYKQKGE